MEARHAGGIGTLDGAPQSEGVLHELASIEVREVQRPIPKIVADDRPWIRGIRSGLAVSSRERLLLPTDATCA
jgi:hypothetical protein